MPSFRIHSQKVEITGENTQPFETEPFVGLYIYATYIQIESIIITEYNSSSNYTLQVLVGHRDERLVVGCTHGWMFLGQSLYISHLYVRALYLYQHKL
jgi:hypothetical protein